MSIMSSSKRSRVIAIFAGSTCDHSLPLTSEAKKNDGKASHRPPTCALGVRISHMRPCTQAEAPLLSSFVPHRQLLDNVWNRVSRDESHYPGESETFVMSRPKSSLRHPEAYQTWLEYTQNMLSREEKSGRTSSKVCNFVSLDMLKEVHSSLKRLKRMCFLNEGDERMFKWCYIRRRQELLELSRQLEGKIERQDLHRLSREAYQNEAHDLLLKRIVLKYNPKIRRAASKFWLLIKSQNKNLVYKKEYIDFNIKAFYALLPFFDKQYVMRAVELDWLVEVGGKKDCLFIAEDQFYTSMFELVDNWCEVQEAEAFTLWLNKLWCVLVDSNLKLFDSLQIVHDERYWLNTTNPFLRTDAFALTNREISRQLERPQITAPRLSPTYGRRTSIKQPRTWAAELKELERSEAQLKLSDSNVNSDGLGKATFGDILSELHPKTLKPLPEKFRHLRSAAFARINTPDDLKLLHTRFQRTMTAARSLYKPHQDMTTLLSPYPVGFSELAKINTLQECRVATGKVSEIRSELFSEGKSSIQLFADHYAEDGREISRTFSNSSASGRSSTRPTATTTSPHSRISTTPLSRVSSLKSSKREGTGEGSREAISGSAAGEASPDKKRSILCPWDDSSSAEPVEFAGFPSLEQSEQQPPAQQQSQQRTPSLAVQSVTPKSFSKRRRRQMASYNAASAVSAVMATGPPSESKGLWNDGDGPSDFVALSDSSSDEN